MERNWNGEIFGQPVVLYTPGELDMEKRYMAEKTFLVPDVSCDHCVSAIQGELLKIDGVDVVDVDIASKRVTVKHDGKVTDEQLVTGLDEAGYDIAGK